MSEKPPLEVLQDLKDTLQGLLLEVEGLRMHQGSSAEFILMSIERATKALQELKDKMIIEETK